MQDFNKANHSPIPSFNITNTTLNSNININPAQVSGSQTPTNMMFVASLQSDNAFPFSQHLLHSSSALGQLGGNYINNLYGFVPEYSTSPLPNGYSTQHYPHYTLPSMSYENREYFQPKSYEKQENQYYEGTSSHYNEQSIKDERDFIYQMPRSLINPYNYTNTTSQYTTFLTAGKPSDIPKPQVLHHSMPGTFSVPSSHIYPSLLRNEFQQPTQKLQPQSANNFNREEEIQKHKKKRKSDWTTEEDQLLGQLVNEYNEEKRSLRAHWKEISQKLSTNKTPVQCSQRWKRVLDPKLIKGSWTVDEEDQLLNLVDDQGMSWAQVAKVLGDRSDGQCRYWYMKIQNSHQVEWSEDEDQALRELVRVMSTDWEQIYKEMLQKKLSKSTRSPREYKMRWQVLEQHSQQKDGLPEQYSNSLPTPLQMLPQHMPHNMESNQPQTELPPLATVLRGITNNRG